MKRRICFRCNADISSDLLLGGKIVGSYVDFNKKSTGRCRIPLCSECISVLTADERDDGPEIEDINGLND